MEPLGIAQRLFRFFSRDTRLPDRSAFKKGKDAHGDRVMLSSNPYRKGSQRFSDWVRGWSAAIRATVGSPEGLNEMPDRLNAEKPVKEGGGDEDRAVLSDSRRHRR